MMLLHVLKREFPSRGDFGVRGFGPAESPVVNALFLNRDNRVSAVGEDPEGAFQTRPMLGGIDDFEVLLVEVGVLLAGFDELDVFVIWDSLFMEQKMYSTKYLLCMSRCIGISYKFN